VTIGKRLTGGLALVLSVMCALSLFCWVKLAQIDRHTHAVLDDALPGVYLASQIQSAVKDDYAYVTQHILAQTEQEMDEIESRMAANAGRVADLSARYEKTIFVQRDRELFDAVQASRRLVTKAWTEDVYPPSRKLETALAQTAFRTKLQPAFDRLVANSSKHIEFNKENGDVASGLIVGAVSSSRAGLLIGLSLALATGGLVSFLIIRSTNRAVRGVASELDRAAHQVASAAGQVAGSAQSLSQGATEQAASLEETSASMEEMASMTRRNAENSEQAAALMGETERLVGGANQALTGMVASMSAIRESSEKVSRIIKTIDEIAFQTNILALNAAVEAARAGESGMGFAVVAEEVRSLAQRSAQAARDTSALIEESTTNARDGHQRVTQVSGAMAAITESAVRVKALIDGVSAASRQQAQGIDQVSEAVTQMEKVTQTTAATAEESAAASEELSAQADTTMTVVGQLAALVGGTATATETPQSKRATPNAVARMPKPRKTAA